MESSGSRQYRATWLWNEIIKSFREGVPTGKHRKHIRTYDNCFVASEAVSWLHDYLKADPNFGPSVSRQQTVLLLRKFVESAIIEAVKGNKRKLFQDDKQLYRFVPRPSPKSTKSPARPKGRNPLSSRENRTLLANTTEPFPVLNFDDKADAKGCSPSAAELPECKQEENIVNRRPLLVPARDDDVQSIWRSVTLARLRVLLGKCNVDTILKEHHLSGRTVMHNMFRLSGNGVVVLMNKSDDLPKWVINAMKCLIHWPKAPGSCLPNYPGFEFDVLKVVGEFFTGLRTHLVPEPVCNLFCLAFGILRDNDDDDDSNDDDSQVQSPGASIENLLSSMSARGTLTHLDEREHYKHHRNRGSTFGANLTHKDGFAAIDAATVLLPRGDRELGDRVSLASHSSTDNDVTSSADTASTISTCSSTMGKPASSAALTNDHRLEKRREGVEACRLNVERRMTLFRTSSFDDLTRYACASASVPKEAVIKNTASLEQREILTLRKIKRKEELKKTRNEEYLRVDPAGGYVNLGFGSTWSVDSEPRRLASSDSLQDPSYSSSQSSTRDSGGVACVSYRQNSESCENILARVGRVGSKLVRSPSLGGASQVPFYANPLSCGVFDGNARRDLWTVVQALQVSSLLLEPRSRRYLHLLLRFIYKTSRNTQLVLSADRTNFEVLVESFTDTLFNVCHRFGVTRGAARDLLVFMVEHCDGIFAPPRELHREVEARLVILRRGGRTHDTDSPAATTFCKRVTMEEFEAQKKRLSEKALMDLFDDILRDPRLSDKERSRRMKQFQDTYPHIYDAKTCDERPTGFKRNSTARSTVIGLFRSLRL